VSTPRDWLDDERVLGPLDDAPLLHLAVAGRNGPRVTPLAFDRSGRDLWALTPRDSAKVRAIRRDPRVGILVRHRGRSVIARGTAHLVDPLAGRGLGSLLRPDLPLTALGYLARNDRRVVGTVLDGPSPSLPLTRTGLRITLDRVAVLHPRHGPASWGRWPDPTTLLCGDLPGDAPDPAPLPAALRPLLATAGPAVLGWHTTDGPTALPARWHPAGAIEVPTGALELVGGLVAAPACLTVQRSRHRISSVRGVLLSGPGRARAGDAATTVRIAPERISWWSGEDTGTVNTTSNISSGRTA
jgi:hypothetical protein